MDLFELHQAWAESIGSGIYSKIPHDKRGAHSVDQLKQAALLGLNCAVAAFKPDMGSFKQFAYKRVYGAAIDELRQSTGWRNGKERPEVNGDFVDGVTTESPSASIEDQEELDRLLKLIPNGLQRRVVKMHYIDGMDCTEIGACFKFSKSYAVKLLKAGQWHLRSKVFQTKFTREEMWRRVLFFIENADKPLTNKDLVRMTGLSPGNVSDATYQLKIKLKINTSRPGKNGINCGGWVLRTPPVAV